MLLEQKPHEERTEWDTIRIIKIIKLSNLKYNIIKITMQYYRRTNRRRNK